MQQELRLHREQLFSRLSFDSVIFYGMALLHTMNEREKRKWLRTIPLDPGLNLPNATVTDNPPTTRRSLLRKCQQAGS